MRRFRKHRFEALSDGVFAIAMTLLVLDLKVPDDLPGAGLGHILHLQSHNLMSFLVTFGIASVFWFFQHQLFDLMEDMSTATLFPTFVFLGLVSLLPFSTSVWGHHIGDRTAFLIYFGNQFCISIALFAKFGMARSEGLIIAGTEGRMIGLRLGFLCLVMGAALAGAAMAPLNFVWIPPVIMGLLGKKLRTHFRARYENESQTSR